MTTTTSPTERVGRYQLLEPIGIGPSGAVSRAKVFGVAGFERQFAVKRFHPELTATAAMAAMLSAAARAYGSLEHPRIARMSEFGVAQGSTFTAIEYVLGLDALRLIGEARLAGVTLAAGGALALVSQAARAVGYAHGRGLTHLGLAPTNVIVTAEGDIKITDFGILSATLPQRPIEVSRLAQRIPYLAPEQLANEATSAATDVFALGVLAYELVTGTRTFKGETPQQVASAIMAGPPAEPALPRPIVRVLQRCLARSPFERFPDARALADALDAALRVAPVPGTRKDIGAQVKETLDRLAALNEGQMSGMVALHLGTGPIRRPDELSDLEPGPPDLGAPYELGRAEPPGAPTMLGGPGATLPDLPRSPMTMPGVPPPPIPVPSGLAGIPTPASSGQSAPNTLLGLGKGPPGIPTIRPPARPTPVTGGPARPPAVPSAALRPGARFGTDLSVPIDERIDLPPAPPQTTATSESAVHPLDPSDLVPFDAPPGEYDDGTGVDLPDPASLPDEFGMSQPLALLVEAPATDGWPARVETTYRLDPSTVDTKPIPPVTLEPLLFDPILRDPEPPAEGDDAAEAGQPPIEAGNDDASQAPPISANDRVTRRLADGADRVGSGPHAMPVADARDSAANAVGSAASELRPGRTMLGYATPFPPMRMATPTPAPATSIGAERDLHERSEPAGEPGSGAVGEPANEAASQAGINAPGEPAIRERRDSGAAEIASMRHEGFRTGPGPVLTAVPPVLPSWQHDPNQPPLDPSLQLSPPGPMPLQLPPGMSLDPSEAPSGPQMPLHEASRMPISGWAPHHSSGLPMPVMPEPPRPLRRAMWILVGMLGTALVGVIGWRIYDAATEKPGKPSAGSAPIAAAEADAQIAAIAPGAAPPSATATADAATDAVAVPSPAISPVPAPPTTPSPGPNPPAPGPNPPPGPTGPSDSLTIVSTPPGARVFLDGADTGATPVKLPGSPDRHTIALLLAGHELYVAQVDGHGSFQIPLKEVTPTNGPAGIKVLRCKDKDRYYVSVDGKPTGQTCPTERIGCEVGPHTVEVYDIVSETRRTWEIVVKDTRLSFRIRVE